ncbi:hypothetical protein [Oceanidesulfovibrio marinus]|uniref:Uncharacterized protein n=1 Tax=Oceanidesulfovibrio marinus TaxID=370038 RepID=A0A6P1ZFA8_9BACT|nr:hypothetical protein [Oceanidesulfovibrio marinus]TVM31013.1 hypothetical protein DQK91_19430 [Oceanidesulfovibrio marinus]
MHAPLRIFTGIVCPVSTRKDGSVADVVLACAGERDVRIHMDAKGKRLVHAALSGGRGSLVHVLGWLQQSSKDDASGGGVRLHVHRFELFSGAGPESKPKPFPDQETVERK